MRNGGLNITLPEDSINTVRWAKSLGDCLSNADPMTAENSQHRIKRVIREENKEMLTEKIGKVKMPLKITSTPWRRKKGHPIGSMLTPQEIRLLINEDGVPRWSCNSLWMETEEYPSIVSMWRKFQSTARTALCQKRIYPYETQRNPRHFRQSHERCLFRC